MDSYSKPEFAITVVVPVYNGETYLLRCVNDLLSQTCDSLEIILVDDGSNDGSGQLIRDLEANHTNIKGVVLDHGGPMRARLCGVKHASAPWIGFADADDTMDPQMYENLLYAGQEDDADMVLCGYKQVLPDGTVRTYKSSPEATVIDRIDAIEMLLSYTHVEMWSLCTKLVKRHLFTDSIISELSKVSVKHYEDLLTNYHLIKEVSHIISIPQCPYHHRIRYDSASYTDSIENCYMDELTVREMILENSDQKLLPIAKYSFLQLCTRIYSELRSVYKPDHVYCQRVLDLILKHR